ncbi:MAG: hypothetical protein GWP10_07425 [Nitrospiraceae bacterium]|nr:hypothetical protein [Nitrospiraceae bacterium]
MDKALNKNITSLFDHIIENSYNDDNVRQKFCGMEEYINENKQSISYVEKNIKRLFDADFELYIRSMNYVIEKSLPELEILFLRVAISNSNCFRDLYTDLTCSKLIRNIIKILLNCRLRDYLDITMSKKFIIGKDDTKLISYGDLETNELVNLLNLAKDKYIEILTKDVCDIDENRISGFINKLNTVYKDFKICSSIPTSMILFSLENLSYSDNNIETLFDNMPRISHTEYDTEMFNKYGILLLPYISDIEISNKKLTFLNNGFGVLENGILQISSNDNKILMSSKIQTTFYQKVATVYLDLTPILKDLDPNSSIIFKIVFEKFGQEYTFVFRRIVGKLIDDCKSETGDIMTNINIGGNGNIVTVGNDNQIVSLHSMKELDELIQRLKTNSLGEYAEQLENARKSNDVNQIKSILSKLKNVVSGSAEMVGMIAKIIPILDLLKNSSS